MKDFLVRFLSLLSEQSRNLTSRLWAAEARLRGADLRGPVLFLGRPILTMAPGSRMIFQGRNKLHSSPRCNAVGNATPCVLRTLAPGAVLEIGAGVGMSSTTICAAASIIIGEGTILGAGSMLIDNDLHQPEGEFGWRDAGAEDARPIRIGRGCFLGSRCIVLKGVTLGDRVVVGAGAVVTKDAPAGSTIVGNPGRVLAR